MAPILTRVGQAFGFGASSGGAAGHGPGMEATGGVISDYDDSGQKYRSHTFTNSGGANIGYCSNPTGDITLNVTGIPTSSFDNQALTFSLIVDNSTAAAAGVRTCNTVKLNNVTKTIRWSGGSVGTGNTTSYDIFNFTGINTIGSGTTTANYEVFGLVNGDFRLY